MESTFELEGRTDVYNIDSELIKASTKVAPARRAMGISKNGKRTYSFVFVPNDGFLNSNSPLLRDCELKLSFDRSIADLSFIQIGEITDDLANSVLKIENCFAVTEYISSEELRRKFSKIDTRPITYTYENCDINLKTLPLKETTIRIDNIRGGNNPSLLFAGIIKTAALNGNMKGSSTDFHQCNVSRINITLNGKIVNGYPLENNGNSPVMAIQKFYDVTNRYMNIQCSDGFRLSMYKSNWLYAHRFEAETTSQGWIGVHLEFTEAPTESLTLVVWSIQTCALTVDKFHQVEKIIL